MEDKKQTRILLVNDMAGYGKVALSVMIPVLSHLKFETFNLPTALVSNTLDYGQFDILGHNRIYGKYASGMEETHVFFSTQSVLDLLCQKNNHVSYMNIAKNNKKSGTSIFVDPIMGDDGKRYNGVTDQAVTYMKRLCSIADVIIPNITEACFLSGYTVKNTYSEVEIEVIANRLHMLGAKSVVITSANINGRMFTVVKNSPKNSCVLLPYDEIPVRFPGTGDIFMAIVVGHYLKSGLLLESVEIAMRQLEKNYLCQCA